MHVPGGLLTITPPSRTVRFVASTVLGWSVFREVRVASGRAGPACPRLRRGQYVVQRSWYSHSGATTTIRSRTRIWRSKKQHAASKQPLCDISTVVGTYR